MTMRAARYLNVDFFDMLERPVIWRTRALMAEAAEKWVEGEIKKKEAARRSL